MIYIIVCFYLMGINLIAFCVYGIDKKRAVKGKWRISEKALLLLAVIGGSVGAYFGMRLFHHKTKHPKFYIGIPVIFAAQLAIVLAIGIL